MNEFESYLYGLLITDGNLSLSTRNRGKVQLEVSIKDKDIIEKLYNNIPNSSIIQRERDTNFSNNYHSIIWYNSRLEFRTQLINWGFPIENKTLTANVPKVEYSEKDFWRGVIDGDGSLGYINDGSPFISLVTKSEFLKEAYLLFLFNNFQIRKNINRNVRDEAFNIILKNEDALNASKLLYENNTISINRKYESFETIQQWVRTKEKHSRRAWTIEEDNYILSHSLKENSNYLNRSESSVKNRLYRLKSK